MRNRNKAYDARCKYMIDALKLYKKYGADSEHFIRFVLNVKRGA